MMEPIFDLILFSLLVWACYQAVRVVQGIVQVITKAFSRSYPGGE